MLVLASKSPRRKELLSIITPDFQIIPAVGEERADKSLPPGAQQHAKAENFLSWSSLLNASPF